MDATAKTMKMWELKELWLLFEKVPKVPTFDACTEMPWQLEFEVPILKPLPTDYVIMEPWNFFPAGTRQSTVYEWMYTRNREFDPSVFANSTQREFSQSVAVPKILPSNCVEYLLTLSQKTPYHVLMTQSAITNIAWSVEYNETDDKRNGRRLMEFHGTKSMADARVLADRLNLHYYWRSILKKMEEPAGC